MSISLHDLPNANGVSHLEYPICCCDDGDEVTKEITKVLACWKKFLNQIEAPIVLSWKQDGSGYLELIISSKGAWRNLPMGKQEEKTERSGFPSVRGWVFSLTTERSLLDGAVRDCLLINQNGLNPYQIYVTHVLATGGTSVFYNTDC